MHVHRDWTGSGSPCMDFLWAAFLSCKRVSDALLGMQVHGSWMGNGFPPGTSYGRTSQYMMGTSPYGKSVDMVDVCTKLMEGAALPLQLAWCLCWERWLTCTDPVKLCTGMS